MPTSRETLRRRQTSAAATILRKVKANISVRDETPYAAATLDTQYVPPLGPSPDRVSPSQLHTPTNPSHGPSPRAWTRRHQATGTEHGMSCKGCLLRTGWLARPRSVSTDRGQALGSAETQPPCTHTHMADEPPPSRWSGGSRGGGSPSGLEAVVLFSYGKGVTLCYVPWWVDCPQFTLLRHHHGVN